MNLRQQLAVAHSRANADLILAYLEKERARTQVLMDVIRSKDPADAKLVQRAAMVLGDLGRRQPKWLLPHHLELLELARTATHPALPRAVTRYFSELPLGLVEENARGRLLDLSFHYLTSAEANVTLKVFSMSTLATFAAHYPELIDEVRGEIQRQFEEGGNTPGFYSRGRKVLKQLDRLRP